MVRLEHDAKPIPFCDTRNIRLHFSSQLRIYISYVKLLCRQVKRHKLYPQLTDLCFCYVTMD